MIKKVLEFLYTVVFVIIIGVGVLLVASTFSVKGLHLYVVTSGSMEPTIHTGSLVAVSPASNYAIGDIITFKPSSGKGEPTTHRINDIRIDTGSPVYQTKGDANNTEDGRSITNADILGRVRFAAPYLGYAVAFIKKPIGFTVLVILPAAIIIGMEMRKIWQEIMRIKQKRNSDNNPDKSE